MRQTKIKFSPLFFNEDLILRLKTPDAYVIHLHLSNSIKKEAMKSTIGGRWKSFFVNISSRNYKSFLSINRSYKLISFSCYKKITCKAVNLQYYKCSSRDVLMIQALRARVVNYGYSRRSAKNENLERLIQMKRRVE